MVKDVDALAIAMRDALGKSQGNETLVPWDKARASAKKEWRVCARAAIKHFAARPTMGRSLTGGVTPVAPMSRPVMPPRGRRG